MALDEFGNYNGPGQRFGVGVQTKRGAIGFNLTASEAARARKMKLAESLGVQDVQGIENYAEPQILGMGNQLRERKYEEEQQNNVMQQREAKARQTAMEDEQKRTQKMEYLKGLGGGRPPRGMSPVEWESVMANSPDVAEKMLFGERTNALNEEQMAIRQRSKAAQSKALGESVVRAMGITDPQLQAEAMALAQQEGVTPEVLKATVGGRLRAAEKERASTVQADKDRLRSESDSARARQKEQRDAMMGEREAAKWSIEQEERTYSANDRDWRDQMNDLAGRREQAAKIDPDAAKAIDVAIADMRSKRPTRDAVNAAMEAYRNAVRRTSALGQPADTAQTSEPVAPPAPKQQSPAMDPGQSEPPDPITPVGADSGSENPTFATGMFDEPMNTPERTKHPVTESVGDILTQQEAEQFADVLPRLRDLDPEAYRLLSLDMKQAKSREDVLALLRRANDMVFQSSEEGR